MNYTRDDAIEDLNDEIRRLVQKNTDLILERDRVLAKLALAERVAEATKAWTDFDWQYDPDDTVSMDELEESVRSLKHGVESALAAWDAQEKP